MSPGGNDRPIFVVGCPRSGTTLLQVMLHSHPRIAIPPETRFLIPAYVRRNRFGDLREEENRRKVARYIVDRKESWFHDLGLDGAAVTEEIAAGPPTIGSALGIVYRAYARRFDKPRWGDKRPGYHRHIEILLRLFPDAQFIHLVRDPRDCVASLKRMGWWKRGSYRAILGWAQAIDNVAEAKRRWPDRVYELQYERLVADPEPELRALCAAIGEEYDPAMATPEELAPVAVPERKHWHSNTHQSPTTAAIGRWREGLYPWELALCETVLARRMARFGYERTGAAGRPAPQHLVRYARTNIAWRRGRRRWRKGEAERRAAERNPVAAQLSDRPAEVL